MSNNRTEPGPLERDEVWTRGPFYSKSDLPLARTVVRRMRDFFQISASGSILLLLATAVALAWANSPWADSYDELWHTTITFDLGVVTISESLQHWVNDALMVVFFLVVGLEIKHELVNGDLRDPRAAALPMVAALGGMVVPALIYVAFTAGGEGTSGWGIPMATDIAFAMGVIGVLGRRIPSAARLFLLTLAIADDIGAIVVIAVFYTQDLSLSWLGIAVGLIALVVLLRVLNVWAIWVYVLVGAVLWYAMLESGVHATLTGVALGLLAPAVPLLKENVTREYTQQALADRRLDVDELQQMRFLLDESVPVVERVQARLHPFSAYVVLPVFALANAGVHLGGGVLGEAVRSSVALGITFGLVVGKPVGITLFTFLAVKLGLGRLPDRTSWAMITGLGMVAGIGFTVSLFIAGLSFPGEELLTDEAKVGILGASLIAAVLGLVGLRVVSPGQDAPGATDASAGPDGPDGPDVSGAPDAPGSDGRDADAGTSEAPPAPHPRD